MNVGLRVSVGVFAAAIALRPPLTGVGPLLVRVQADLGTSHAVAGLVVGVLLILMGVSSLLAPRAIRWLGWRQTITLALVLGAGAALLRAFMPTISLVILLTIPVGIGVGIAGAALPAAVSDLYLARKGTGTAVLALGINIGAAGSAVLAAPLAEHLGGWRSSLALFGIVGLGLGGIWWIVVPDSQRQVSTQTLSIPWRAPRAWLLTTIFALQGLCYYGFGAWLPTAYQERGWSEATAGALVAAIALTAVPASFVVPRLSELTGSRRAPLLVCTVSLLIGSIGLTAIPSVAWGWAVLVGVSLGGLFALCLLLAIDFGQIDQSVAGFTGMMLGLGYVVSAAAPIVLGVARDSAGSFSTALWLSVAIAALLLVLVLSSRRSLFGLDAALRHTEE